MTKVRITEAQRIADRIGADAVVIFAFTGDQVSAASYGATKAKCAIAGKWLDQIVDGMGAGHMPAPQL